MVLGAEPRRIKLPRVKTENKMMLGMRYTTFPLAGLRIFDKNVRTFSVRCLICLGTDVEEKNHFYGQDATHAN